MRNLFWMDSTKNKIDFFMKNWRYFMLASLFFTSFLFVTLCILSEIFLIG